MPNPEIFKSEATVSVSSSTVPSDTVKEKSTLPVEVLEVLNNMIDSGYKKISSLPRSKRNQETIAQIFEDEFKLSKLINPEVLKDADRIYSMSFDESSIEEVKKAKAIFKKKYGHRYSIFDYEKREFEDIKHRYSSVVRIMIQKNASLAHMLMSGQHCPVQCLINTLLITRLDFYQNRNLAKKKDVHLVKEFLLLASNRLNKIQEDHVPFGSSNLIMQNLFERFIYYLGHTPSGSSKLIEGVPQLKDNFRDVVSHIDDIKRMFAKDNDAQKFKQLKSIIDDEIQKISANEDLAANTVVVSAESSDSAAVDAAQSVVTTLNADNEVVAEAVAPTVEKQANDSTDKANVNINFEGENNNSQNASNVVEAAKLEVQTQPNDQIHSNEDLAANTVVVSAESSDSAAVDAAQSVVTTLNADNEVVAEAVAPTVEKQANDSTDKANVNINFEGENNNSQNASNVVEAAKLEVQTQPNDQIHSNEDLAANTVVVSAESSDSAAVDAAQSVVTTLNADNEVVAEAVAPTVEKQANDSTDKANVNINFEGENNNSQNASNVVEAAKLEVQTQPNDQIHSNEDLAANTVVVSAESSDSAAVDAAQSVVTTLNADNEVVAEAVAPTVEKQANDSTDKANVNINFEGENNNSQNASNVVEAAKLEVQTQPNDQIHSNEDLAANTVVVSAESSDSAAVDAAQSVVTTLNADNEVVAEAVAPTVEKQANDSTDKANVNINFEGENNNSQNASNVVEAAKLEVQTQPNDQIHSNAQELYTFDAKNYDFESQDRSFMIAMIRGDSLPIVENLGDQLKEYILCTLNNIKKGSFVLHGMAIVLESIDYFNSHNICDEATKRDIIQSLENISDHFRNESAKKINLKATLSEEENKMLEEDFRQAIQNLLHIADFQGASKVACDCSFQGRKFVQFALDVLTDPETKNPTFFKALTLIKVSEDIDEYEKIYDATQVVPKPLTKIVGKHLCQIYRKINKEFMKVLLNNQQFIMAIENAEEKIRSLTAAKSSDSAAVDGTQEERAIGNAKKADAVIASANESPNMHSQDLDDDSQSQASQQESENNFWQSKSKVLTGKTNATDAQIITAVGTVGVMSAAGCIAVGVLKETIISKSGPAAFLAPIALLSVASVFFLTFAIAAASMLLLHYNDYKKQDQPSTQIENQSTEQAAETEKVIA